MPSELLVRTSERSSFKRCRQQWHWAYNERIKPTEEAPALKFGNLIHLALEARYPKGVRRGPHPAKTFARLFDEELERIEESWGFRDADGEWADAKELGVAMLEEYVAKYGKDEQYKVISSELTFQVPVPNPRTGKTAFYYVGTIDGVWQDRSDGAVLLNDYKTTKGDPTKFDYLDLDDQADAYWTFGVDWLIDKGIIKADAKLKGMIYTYLRKAFPDERPVNPDGYRLNKPKKEVLLKEFENRGLTLPKKGSGKNGSVLVDDLIDKLGPECLMLGEVSENQPAPLFHREVIWRYNHQRELVRARAFDEVREMHLARKGELGIYKNPGGAPPLNNCRFCGYKDICQLHEVGQDWQSLRDVTMVPWDPYAAHEIQEEGKRG